MSAISSINHNYTLAERLAQQQQTQQESEQFAEVIAQSSLAEVFAPQQATALSPTSNEAVARFMVA